MPRFTYHFFGTLSSTNDTAKQFARKGTKNSIIVAATQTKARGRFPRKWLAQPGGLYATLVLEEMDATKIRYLTFLISLAVSRTLFKLAGTACTVKWPNDVYIGDRKVCGVLTEILTRRNKHYALVGIGVNVNQTKFSKRTLKATSLTLETKMRYNIETVLKKIIAEFNALFPHYKKNNVARILSLWKKNSHTLGKWVTIKSLRKKYWGKALDVDREGNLILKLKNGKMKTIIEGDVFVD